MARKKGKKNVYRDDLHGAPRPGKEEERRRKFEKLHGLEGETEFSLDSMTPTTSTTSTAATTSTTSTRRTTSTTSP